jgi:hypothetical protein
MTSTSGDATKSGLALITVRQLLSRESLSNARLIAGDEGADKLVDDIFIFSALSLRSDLEALNHKILILDATHYKNDSYQIDVLIREAFDHGASALIVLNYQQTIGPTAIRLANKLSFPLISISGVDSLRLADDFRRIIRLPFIARSDAVLKVAEKFRNLPKAGALEAALKVLGEVLDARTALLRPDRSAVAKSDNEDFNIPKTLELLEVPLSENEGKITYLLQPLSLAPRESSGFWLAVALRTPSEGWKKVASEVMGVASWYFSSILIASRLVQERDARFRLGVLNAIFATNEHSDPALLNQLGILGWRVDGWCTAIHVQLAGDVDPLRVLNGSPELQQAFSKIGFVGPLIERPDGWSGWIVEKSEPQSKSYAKLAADFRLVIEKVSLNSPGTQIYLGIGRPYEGILGLQKSLSEAKDACTIAQLGGKNWDIQHVDEMGVRRILLGWYASESFAQFATTLLASIRDSDSDGELLQTLETYLDSNCSPSETAIILNVHRNTVINRVDKLRSLLKVNLDEPDERLALQLACRVIKRKWEA